MRSTAKNLVAVSTAVRNTSNMLKSSNLNTQNAQNSIEKHFNSTYPQVYYPSRDLGWSVYSKKIRTRLLERSKKPSVILDIGCGAGTTLYALNNHTQSQLFGIDASKEAVKLAKDFVPNATFYVGDFFSTHFPQKFDFIVSTMVIEHIEDEDRFFSKIKDLSQPGALIEITTVFRKKWRFYYLRNEKGEIVLEKTHVREYESIEDLLKYFRKYNIEIEEVVVQQLRYPLIDVLFKILNRTRFEYFRRFGQTQIGDFLRKITRIPIIGYYSFEILGTSK